MEPVVFRHVLIKAHCRKELAAALGIGLDDLRIVRFRPFGTRLAATEFLQLKLNMLRSSKAIAAPVRLPMSDEYTRALEELTALGERLRTNPAGWQSSKAQIEKKIVEQTSKLSYMELHDTETPKELYWVVYLAEESHNGRLGLDRPLLQSAN